MLRFTPALEALEREIALDPRVAPDFAEAREIYAAMCRAAEARGAWDRDPLAGLEGDIALARALRGLPPA